MAAVGCERRHCGAHHWGVSPKGTPKMISVSPQRHSSGSSRMCQGHMLIYVTCPHELGGRCEACWEGIRFFFEAVALQSVIWRVILEDVTLGDARFHKPRLIH